PLTTTTTGGSANEELDRQRRLGLTPWIANQPPSATTKFTVESGPGTEAPVTAAPTAPTAPALPAGALSPDFLRPKVEIKGDADVNVKMRVELDPGLIAREVQKAQSASGDVGVSMPADNKTSI